ncbi:MAG: MarR family transcriptional regulator [Planctomycetota bacterium]|nr:MarR family transcriptional regulator [Planctomycetota bacterium]
MPNQATIEGIVSFAGRMEGIDLEALREGLEIARVHRRVDQAIESDLAGWGLTARQVEIMESLYHNARALTPAELADEVGLTRSAMTSALDALESSGHTVRRPHPTDRRMVAITLTPSGRAFIEGRLPERYQRIHSIVSHLSKEERDLLLRTYAKVLAFLTDDEEPVK